MVTFNKGFETRVYLHRFAPEAGAGPAVCKTTAESAPRMWQHIFCKRRYLKTENGYHSYQSLSMAPPVFFRFFVYT